MIVSKFGGTSLSTAQQIEKVCRIVAAEPDRRIIVVSAPGKRTPDDIKVTDLLIAVGNTALERGAAAEEVSLVVERYREIQQALDLPEKVIDDIQADLEERVAGDRSDPHVYVDALKAGGEDNCARLVAEALNARGLYARYVSPREAGLLLSDEYGNARVLPESYENLKSLREALDVVVFPGFFGYTRDGKVATFPRGGSDITGAIVAAAVGADLYENFTDVDSVLSADPRDVPKAQPIRELTYREMRELSYAGFGVFHDEAIEPAIRARIPVCIRNTNAPDGPGTMLLPTRQHTPGEVVGIAGTGGFCAIYLQKYLMNRMIGFARKLMRVLEDEGIPFEHMPSGIDNLSVIFREKHFTHDKEQNIVSRLRKELEPDDLHVERGLALVMIVGEGMHHALGVAGRAATALAEAGVNIEMINQGSSEISMMFGVKADGCHAAVRALHETFLEA